MWRVETEEEAQARIQETKKKYYDARHNCWCYLLGPNLVRYSDDGEPQGTAGQPMLNVFQRENVTGAVCVVTRYFGGILLGAGGLTRAYSKGARDALAAAGVADHGAVGPCAAQLPYPLFERVKLEIAAASGILDDMDYSADVTLTVSLPSERRETLQGRLTELSAGGLTLALMEESYRPAHGRSYNGKGEEGMKYTEYTDEQIQEIKRQRDRRKRQQITVIVFILGVLFALVGILERGGAIYLVLGIACLLMGVMLLVDHIRREREEKAKKQDAADADKE